MKIAIGNDHIALPLKRHIVKYLTGKGYEIADMGTCAEERCDYPVYGERVALAVKEGRAERGILICGTGVGISLAANKVPGIRCAVCSESYTARLSRRHNDANILAFGAMVVGDAVAEMLVDAFLEGEYEGGRHQKRIDMITGIERRHGTCTG